MCIGSGEDARAVDTGLITSMNPMTTGGAIAGQAFAQEVTDNLSTAANETTAVVPCRQAVAAHTFANGKVLDSRDNMAPPDAGDPLRRYGGGEGVQRENRYGFNQVQRLVTFLGLRVLSTITKPATWRSEADHKLSSDPGAVIL